MNECFIPNFHKCDIFRDNDVIEIHVNSSSSPKKTKQKNKLKRKRSSSSSSTPKKKQKTTKETPKAQKKTKESLEVVNEPEYSSESSEETSDEITIIRAADSPHAKAFLSQGAKNSAPVTPLASSSPKTQINTGNKKLPKKITGNRDKYYSSLSVPANDVLVRL